MTQSTKHWITLSICLILIVTALFLIFPISKSTRLGLDLKGGMRIIFKAKPAPGTPVTKESLDRAKFILNQRVDKLGVAEVQITVQEPDNIVIELPGIKKPQEALEVLGKVALLEFKEVLGTDEKGNAKLGKTLLTGKYLKNAQVSFDQFGKAKVDMEFTDEGAKKFEEITARYVGKQIAIVLDGKVMSAPRVIEKISGGRAEITGNFTIDEAKRLAIVLQTGALPVNLEIQEKQIVGPTLGKESLIQALYAAIAGLILVGLYMIIYYRSLGIVAALSLVSFGILLWGVIAAINRLTPWGWPLSLPSMAGVILMIGVAADSCVVIFERIKEEVRAGKKIHVAGESGFVHSIITILDADLVTFLVAITLVFLGVGPVKGFAVSLASGILIDLFVTYTFTRPIVALLLRAGWIKRPILLGFKEVANR
ncbi:MAG: protein translocase subunit SecD [Actinobacteria bacterium]|nr:protein translocase subunit SecD [Actinomycetota bacterium]